MNRFVFGMAVLVSSTLARAALAGPDAKKEEPPLRLEVDLVDGSRVVGVTGIEVVPVETSYAKINVPLRQIQTMKIGEDHETVTFDMQNGDKLKGGITLAPIKLATVFGPVSIGVEHVRQLDVMRSDGPPQKGLVLHFSFDKEDRDLVADNSGKGNEGRALGATWIREGKRGGGFQFDGKQTLVNAGRKPELDIVQNLTMSAWIRKRPKTFGDGLQGIVGKDDGPDWPGRSYMLFMVDVSEQKILAFSYGVKTGGINGRHDLIAKEASVSDDQWHHVAVVHETGVGNRLYVDGNCVAEDGEGSPLPSNPNTDTIVGKTQAWEPWFFYGAMDDVMIYNRALNTSEIKQIYNAQK